MHNTQTLPDSAFCYTDFPLQTPRGRFLLRHGKQSDSQGNPSNQWSVWLWNGHYWEILIADAGADRDECAYAARWHLTPL